MKKNYNFNPIDALKDLGDFIKNHASYVKDLNLDKGDRAAEIFEAFGYVSVADAFFKHGYSVNALNSNNKFTFKKTPSSVASNYSYFQVGKNNKTYFILKDHNIAGSLQGTFNLDVVVSRILIDKKLEKNDFLSVIECKLCKGVSSSLFSSFRGIAFDSVILHRWMDTNYPPPLLYTSGKPTKYSSDFIWNTIQKYWVSGAFGISGHQNSNPLYFWLNGYV